MSGRKFFLVSLKGGIIFIAIVVLMLFVIYHMDKTILTKSHEKLVKLYTIHSKTPSFLINAERIENDILFQFKRLHLIVFIITGSFFSLLFFFSIRMLVIRRLKHLILNVREIANRREFNRRIEINGKDEIASLKNGINFLLNNIESNEQSLKRARERLEERIKERTEKLKYINLRLNEEIKLQRKLKEDLVESKNMYKSLIENAGQMILIVQDEKIVYYNREFSRVTGYDEKELIGSSFLVLVHPDDKYKVIRFHHRRMKGEIIPPYEIRIITKYNRLIYGEVSAVRVIYRGKPASLGFVTDITEKKRLEEERKNLQEQLLQSQKMEAIGRFAGGIVHDFNNLLTPIIGYTELLIAQDDYTECKREYLKEIRDATIRATELINQLLALSRKQVLSIRRLNINRVIKNLKTMLQRLIGEDIRLRIELDKHIGDIMADKSQIEQIILNLVVNAIDAMPGGGEITIRTAEVYIDDNYAGRNVNAKSGRMMCMKIEDTGHGMDEETKRHIFEPFYTTKGKDKGTGLGLSIVYGIVEQHGGWIEVDSQIGKGTRFSIYFPLITSDEGEEDKSSQCGNYSESKMAGREGMGKIKVKGDKKVLLVEDDEKVRNYIKRILTRYGFKIIDTPSARKALEIFLSKKEEIACLITDIITPDITGIDLIKRVKEHDPELKAIVMSGYTDDRFDLEFIKKNEIYFLQKPFSSKDLFNVLEIYNN